MNIVMSGLDMVALCTHSSFNSKATLQGKKGSIQQKPQEADGGNGSGHQISSQAQLHQLCSHKHFTV